MEPVTERPEPTIKDYPGDSFATVVLELRQWWLLLRYLDEHPDEHAQTLAAGIRRDILYDLEAYQTPRRE